MKKVQHHYRHSEEEYIEAGAGILTDFEVAGKLGVTHQAVYNWRKRREIQAAVSHKPKNWTMRAEYRHLANQGLSRQEIADALGTNYAAVTSNLRHFGIEVIHAKTLNARDWLSLDWEKSNKELAQELGCPKHTVCQARYELRKQGHDLPKYIYPGGQK